MSVFNVSRICHLQTSREGVMITIELTRGKMQRHNSQSLDSDRAAVSVLTISWTCNSAQQNRVVMLY
jgi:hypothetical protein